MTKKIGTLRAHGPSLALGAAMMLATACSGGSSGSCSQAQAVSSDVGVLKTTTSGGGSSKQPLLQPLHGHIPAAVTSATDQGQTEGSTPVTITVAMNPKNSATLANDVAAIYTPGSPTYHHYLTPDEFRAKYAPTSSDAQAVQDYLQSQGLSQISMNENGLLIHASGTVAQLETAFNTEIHDYKAADGSPFYAPRYELQAPAGLNIQGVHGLQNLTVRHNHLVQKPAAARSPASETPHTGTASNGGYAPSDIRTAYNVPESGGGSGQTLAVFELDGYTESDITTYESTFGITPVPLQSVLIDGAAGTDSGTSAEQALDIELMIALAPKATKLMVYVGPNSDTGTLDTYAKIASDNLAKSISSSWGSSEASATSSLIQSENTIFMQMAAQGQTMFAAAGDSGAYDNGSTLSVDDPGSQPYVVSVGGTSLTTTTAQAWASETTWNDGSTAAGGGGISSIWSIPTWQTGLANSSNLASSTMRNVPDVSLNADATNGYAIYWQGTWSVWGGTSCAAPLWAGFMGLVNQQRATNGLGTIGYVTPALYAIGESSLYSGSFHDIANGSTNNYYPAVTGYDDATGWGTFNATNLMNDLATDTSAALGGGVLSCS